MIKDLPIATILFFCFWGFSSLNAQWEQIPGPSIANNNTIEVFQSDIFLGGQGGMFELNTDQNFWNKIDVPLLTNVVTIEADSNWIYAASNNSDSPIHPGNYLVKINRQSGEWSQVYEADRNLKDVIAKNDSILLSVDHNLFISTNGGQIWNRGPNFIVAELSLIPQGQLVLDDLDGQIYYSSDWGGNWKNINPDQETRTFDFYELGSNIIIRNKSGHFILNDTLGWTPFSIRDFRPTRINTIFGSDEIIYALYSSQNIVYRSQDKGANWDSLGVQNQYMFLDYFLAENTIVGRQENRVAILNDSLSNIQFINNGFEKAFDTRYVMANEKTLFASNNSGAWTSLDRGKIWSAIDGTGRPNYISEYEGEFWFTVPRSLWYSQNMGTSWLNSNAGVRIPTILEATNEALIVSSENLLTFIRLQEDGSLEKGNISQPNLNTITSIGANDSIIAVSDILNEVSISLNYGSTWTNITNNLTDFSPKQTFFFLEIFNGELIGMNTEVAYLVRYDFDDQMWFSINAPDSLGNRTASFLTQNEGAIFLGIPSEGVLMTYDFKTWHSINDNLPRLNVSSLTFTKDSLFLGISGSSVWKRSKESLPGRTTSVGSFTNKSIHKIHIFPNPTSDILQIDLSRITNLNQKCIFSIFTLTGKLVRQESKLLGDFKYNNIEGLQKGGYILQLQTHDSIYRERFLKL